MVAMDSYRDTAFYLAVWYAVLTALGAILLIALNDVALATGLLIGAKFALLFALILMAWIGSLTDRRILRGQFWHTLPPQKRVAGEAGLRMARSALEQTWLRFAKAAAAVAIVLSALAYASNGVSASGLANAVRKPVMAQIEPGSAWAPYHSARLLPTN
jgi:hypothetical protein